MDKNETLKIIEILAATWASKTTDDIQHAFAVIADTAKSAQRPTKRAPDVGVCTCKKPLWANNGKYNICVSCLLPQRG